MNKCYIAITDTILFAAILFIVTACSSSDIPLKKPYPFDSELECNGTEPFWIMSLTPGRGEFQSMDGEARTFTLSLPLRNTGHTNNWTLQGNNKTDGRPVSITLDQTGQCSDGMSDFYYDFEITLAPGGGQTLKGCCGRQQ